MAETMTKLTIRLPARLMGGVRRAVLQRDITLAGFVRGCLEDLVAQAADDRGQSVEVFCRRTVQLRSGRPRLK